MDRLREARDGADISQVVRLSLELAEVLDVAVEPCPASIGAKAAQLMTSPSGFVALSANGFIAGEVVNSYFDGAQHAQELGWYAPDGNGLSLLKAFEAWANGLGCEAIRFSTRPEPGREAILLKRRGYLPVELAWRR